MWAAGLVRGQIDGLDGGQPDDAATRGLGLEHRSRDLPQDVQFPVINHDPGRMDQPEGPSPRMSLCNEAGGLASAQAQPSDAQAKTLTHGARWCKLPGEWGSWSGSASIGVALANGRVGQGTFHVGCTMLLENRFSPWSRGRTHQPWPPLLQVLDDHISAHPEQLQPMTTDWWLVCTSGKAGGAGGRDRGDPLCRCKSRCWCWCWCGCW